MITKFKLFEYHEETMNRLLDKINKSGEDSLDLYEIELLKNNGDNQTRFESGNIIFNVDNTIDYGDTIKINGIILYQGKKYNGGFELSKIGGNDPMSLLGDFEDFEPDDDDWYNLDDLIQELESVYTN